MLYLFHRAFPRGLQTLSYPHVKLFPCIKPVKCGFSAVLSLPESELLMQSTGINAFL